MTTAAQVANPLGSSRDDTSKADAPETSVRLSFAPNYPLRVLMFRLAGVALILGSGALWVVPGSDAAGELMLLKLGISIFFFFCGLTFLMHAPREQQPDAHFDPIRKEVRVLQRNRQGQPETVLRRSYDSLGRASFSCNSVEFFDGDGALLMRLLIDDAEARKALKSQLSGIVPLNS